MMGFHRARCLSAALILLCFHTVSSIPGYSSSGSHSNPGYGPSSEEYGPNRNPYPGGPYAAGGPVADFKVYGTYTQYIGPNDGRAPNFPSVNPIPQPPVKAGRFYQEPYPAGNYQPNRPVGKPFPQSGYQPSPAPQGDSYPGYGPYSPADRFPYQPVAPKGDAFPSKGYPSFPYPSDPYPQPPVARNPNPYPNKPFPQHPVDPYPKQPVNPKPVYSVHPFAQRDQKPAYPVDPYQKNPVVHKPVHPVDPYPKNPVDHKPVYPVDPYPKNPVVHKPVYPVDPYPKNPVDHKPVYPVDPYPKNPVVHKPVYPVDPYPKNPIGPKPIPYAPVDPRPYPSPGYPSDQYDNKGYPDKQIQVPRPSLRVLSKPLLPSSLCDNCKFKNGVGFNPFPKSCQAYVTCQKYDGYKLLPTKLSCPYNLFWSQQLLTCVRPKNTKCLFDACLAGKGGKNAAVYGNCAAYHVCDGHGRTAEIHCCAYGYRYQPTYGYTKPGYQPCVRDPTCSDTCAPKKTPIRKEKCRLLPVRGVVTKYLELVHHKYIIRSCAPGTAFVQRDCGCTARVKVYPRRGCKAEVFIDFKYGIRDVSGNFISVGNEWDRVKSVKARGSKDGFAGQFHNAQLILWRFANAPLGPPLKIAFAFVENAYKTGGYGGKNEVLVSNGDCGKPASVSITFDRSSQTVTALVDTKSTYGKNYKPAYVSVPYVPGKYKEVIYTYDGKYLTLSVNGKTRSVAAHGAVQVRQCALSLGGVKGGTAFNGLLDDFKLFLCAPKAVTPYSRPAEPAPYPAGKGNYPAGPGPYPAGPAPYPAGPAPYPAGKGNYPAGPGPYPAGPAPYPAGKDNYPAGPGPYPAGPAPYPAGPAPYPAGKGNYPAGPGPYPAGPAPYPAGKDNYPAGPGPYPAGPGPHPAGPAPYPAGPSPYPAGKGNYPAGPDTYSAEPSPYHAGQNSYPAGKDVYPAGPTPYSTGSAPHPAGKQPVYKK